jgi:hypothetical protein
MDALGSMIMAVQEEESTADVGENFGVYGVRGDL